MSGLKSKINKRIIGCLVGFVIIAIVFVLFIKEGKSHGIGMNNKTNINLDTKESLIVLQVGEQYTLDYEGITYVSNNSSVASVNEVGVIDGIGTGTTSIVLKNAGKVCANIMVIVNEEVPTSPNTSEYFGTTDNVINKELFAEKDALTKTLQETYSKEIVVGPEQKKITSHSLYQLHKKNINLTIDCIDYRMYLQGKDIDDYSKNFETKVDFIRCKSGIIMKLKSKDKLPGKVYVKLKNNVYKTKYIYGFNEDLERYDLISDNNKNEVLLSKGEKYLLTDKELYKFKIDSKYFIILGSVLVILAIIYICVKKRYWFW